MQVNAIGYNIVSAPRAFECGRHIDALSSLHFLPYVYLPALESVGHTRCILTTKIFPDEQRDPLHFQ